ncbi:DUF4251 domain-containing protein [Flavobacterium foetidum]|uniref:DUF4251 domain-containing protein n=1 Tax=Flavobacterium foetidum TaxID=2026681 RepID=UPI0010755072|nr:DUF4251 domain-containing protein [Flavobacterium foetidum]KAF2517075.1 DUF4251 domain-containing protein [Flavobacterium foetidum]
MKRKFAIILLLSLFLNNVINAQEKSKKELKAEREQQQKQKIKSLIDAKNFVFEAQQLTPQGGRLIQLDYNTYFLKFNTEKTTCDLPFFGRGFNVGYGNDGGIKFEGKPEDIKVSEKKNGWNLKAVVKGKNDVYNLTFSIFANGKATLTVISNNRASISYDGEISAPKTDVNN